MLNNVSGPACITSASHRYNYLELLYHHKHSLRECKRVLFWDYVICFKMSKTAYQNFVGALNPQKWDPSLEYWQEWNLKIIHCVLSFKPSHFKCIHICWQFIAFACLTTTIVLQHLWSCLRDFIGRLQANPVFMLILKELFLWSVFTNTPIEFILWFPFFFSFVCLFFVCFVLCFS